MTLIKQVIALIIGRWTDVIQLLIGGPAHVESYLNHVISTAAPLPRLFLSLFYTSQFEMWSRPRISLALFPYAHVLLSTLPEPIN